MAKHGHNNPNYKKPTPGWSTKESTSSIDLLPNERVSFDPERFSRAIAQHGTKVKVYRTSYCPRVKSVDGKEHDITCHLCNGSGIVDVLPIDTVAVIQSQTLDHLNQPEGWVDGNTVSMTFAIGIELQYMTLIELSGFTDIYMERIMKNPDPLIQVDNLKYKAKNVNFIMDYDGVMYQLGSDFTLDQNCNIKWTGSRRPSPGTIYTIHYEAAVRFRATKAMHVNRFSNVKPFTSTVVESMKMPELWQCTKEFLTLRRDRNGNIINQGPFDQHIIVEDND